MPAMRQQVKSSSDGRRSPGGREHGPVPAAGDAARVVQRVVRRGEAFSPGELLAMQRTAGNQAVRQLMAAKGAGPAARSPVGPANRTGLPDGLKCGVEQLSGLSLDDVRVTYGSSEPAKVAARATTAGARIHVARGEEQHLAHEAWHVVQQKQGRVRATRRVAGVPVNDDRSLEREADVFGARAAQVGRHALHDALGVPGPGQLVSTPPPLVQRVAASGQVVQALSLTDAWNWAADTAHSVRKTAEHGLSVVSDTAGYLRDGAVGAVSHAAQGVTGALSYGAQGVADIASYGVRGVTGAYQYGRDTVTGIGNYVRDTVTGPANFVGGIPGAYRGTRSRIVRAPDGTYVRTRAVRGGLGALAGHVARGVGGGLAHLARGVHGTVAHPVSGLAALARYGYDGVSGLAAYGRGAYQGTRGYLGRGVTGTGQYLARGMHGLVDNVGYFRGMALGMGALGAGAAHLMNQSPAYGLAAAAIPYAFDLAQFGRNALYERQHPGYHTIEKHSAYHSSGNMRNRLVGVGGGKTRMRNWSLARVGGGPASGQFRTENWHRYSIEQGERQLRVLNPLAVILQARPHPQAPGRRFTLQFPGWDTGISHGPGTAPGGVRTEYVFYNYISPVGAPNSYFLVQHYPVTGPQGGAPNVVVNTRRPI